MVSIGYGKKKKKRNVEEVVKEQDEEEEKVEDENAVHPVVVEYCPCCKFPIEMCEFSNVFMKECVGYLKKEHPELCEKLIESRNNDKHKNKKIKNQIKDKVEEAEVKDDVVIVVKLRSKKKKTLTILGLEHYGVDLKKTAKLWQKKFSCGCARIEKPHPGIEIQGDFRLQLIEILPKDLGIPIERVYTQQKISKKLPNGERETKTIKFSLTQWEAKGQTLELAEK